jgi:hypothetical protein
VPIFDGGRRDARRAEFASQFRQEHVRTNDLHEQIELEVRMALDSLHSAEEQMKVAEAGLSLAQSEFTQARRRYEAGVASSLEVTDAQTRLERARDNRIAALFNHNVARFDLGQATGTILAMVQREPGRRHHRPVMTEPKVPATGAASAMTAASRDIRVRGGSSAGIARAKFPGSRRGSPAVWAAPLAAAPRRSHDRGPRRQNGSCAEGYRAERRAHRRTHRQPVARQGAPGNQNRLIAV